MEAWASHPWSLCVCDRPLLVGRTTHEEIVSGINIQEKVFVDRLRSVHPLVGANCGGSLHWLWSAVHILAVLQLPRRCILANVSPCLSHYLMPL